MCRSEKITTLLYHASPGSHLWTSSYSSVSISAASTVFLIFMAYYRLLKILLYDELSVGQRAGRAPIRAQRITK